MEVRLSKRQRADNFPFFSKSLPSPANPSLNQGLHLQAWPNTTRLFKKHFEGLALIWRVQIQGLSKGQHCTNHKLVHVVKEGETLSSISKQYGVPLHAIVASNKNIVDIDHVYRGQQLSIPSAMGVTQVIGDNLILQEQIHGSLDQRSFISPRRVQVKNTGYLLLLVPFIALCIRFIIGASYTRLTGPVKHDRIDKSDREDGRFRSSRWKSALSDIREPDIFDAESITNSNNLLEDEAQRWSREETSHNYKKLEQDYQNFLSECGLK